MSFFFLLSFLSVPHSHGYFRSLDIFFRPFFFFFFFFFLFLCRCVICHDAMSVERRRMQCWQVKVSFLNQLSHGKDGGSLSRGHAMRKAFSRRSHICPRKRDVEGFSFRNQVAPGRRRSIQDQSWTAARTRKRATEFESIFIFTVHKPQYFYSKMNGFKTL